MMNILKRLGGFLKQRPVLLSLGLLLIFFALPHTALAAPETTAGIADKKNELEQSMAFIFSIGVKTLNTFLWPFLMLIGDLMDNDFIVGPGMETRLLSIWTQIRNIVNIIFAVLFLVVAFYNVAGIGEGEGNFALKTILPKLILGLVLVNFTFLGGKVLLDVSSIATTTAFALPEVVEDFDFSEQREGLRQSLCYEKFVAMNADGSNSPDNVLYKESDVNKRQAPYLTQIFCDFDEDTETYTGELKQAFSATYFEDLNKNNVALVMAINMGALDDQILLDADSINDFSDLTINVLFSLTMYIVFAVSYIVLAIVLVTRVVVMWLALALSPIAVLAFAVPQLKDLAGGGGDMVNKFIKHLFAPAIIGFVLSIGYVMMSALGTAGGTISAFAKLSGENASANILITGIDDIERFLVALTSVVVVWIGIFAATSGTFAETLTGGIKSFGERVAGAAAKAPLFATVIPIATKEDSNVNVSPIQLKNIFDSGLRSIEAGTLGGQDNLRKLAKGRPGLQRLIGSHNPYSGQPPDTIGRSIVRSLPSGNQFDKSDIIGMAKQVDSLIEQSNSISDSDKKRIRDSLTSVQSKASDGDLENAFRELDQVLRDANVNDDNLGTGTAISQLRQSVEQGGYVRPQNNNNNNGSTTGSGGSGATTTPTTAGTVPNVGTLSQAQQGVQLSTFNAQSTRAQIATALTSADASAPLTETSPQVVAIHNYLQNPPTQTGGGTGGTGSP